MQLYCTRPSCPRPLNHCADLDDRATLRAAKQKYCTACGMPLILRGRYLPEKLLGQGGFGTAFYARDRDTPTLRPCVVKLFQPPANLTAEQLQVAQTLFNREAEVLENLGNQHPLIPDLYAFFPLALPSRQTAGIEEFFYLVQEFIDGEDLEQILDRRGPLPEKTVKAILVSLLEVLDFVHSHNHIHRDIKPSNIMHASNGKLYLLDFGAVKQVTGGGGGQSTGIYTTGYAPPELMRGGAVRPSSDLYSLAVTCIVLLTGKPPTELFDSHRNCWQWQSLISLQDGAFAKILDRMLQDTPSQRYDSTQAVLAALKQGLKGQKTTGLVARPGRGTRKPQTRRPFGATRQSGSSPPRPLPVSPVTSPPVPLAQPATIQSPPPGKPPVPQPVQPPGQPTSPPAWLRPLPEFLGGAAFTGFEAGLLAIATASFLGTTWLGSGLWLGLLGGLILLQVKRTLERIDLVLVAGGTLAAVLFLSPLRSSILAISSGNPLLSVVWIAVMAGLGMVAIALLFRLIYRLIAQFL
ncbi:MAG: serine/threonine-protein kinase [Cyanobacteria bacterium P01_G01_bin.38]